MSIIKSTLFIVSLLSLPMAFPAYAGSNYPISELSHVFTDVNGKIVIKWSGAPNPGPCGSGNNGWVIVEASSDKALKSFVYALYVSGKPATIVTSGCNGNKEIVTGIYSPGG